MRQWDERHILRMASLGQEFDSTGKIGQFREALS
jgi:hypothetical protein